MKILLLVISIIFDLLTSNLLRSSSYNLSYFYPMLTITTVVYISNLYSNANRKNYYVLVLIVAVIYDSLTINNLLLSIFLFESIAYLNINLKKLLSNNLFNNLIRVILSIFCYDLLFHLILVVISYQPLNIEHFLYKFTHSLVINILYFVVMFIVLKPKKV